MVPEIGGMGVPKHPVPWRTAQDFGIPSPIGFLCV